MRWDELLITAPTQRVLDAGDVKQHCKIEVTDDDPILEGYIGAAEQRAEDVTGRQLMLATWELKGCGWPVSGWIEVPKPPLQSVTFIKYLDTAGVEQTWAASNYVVTAPSGARAGFGRISLASGASWPTVLDQAGAITIRFVAGYASRVSVPESIKQAMRLMIGTWAMGDAGREDIVTGTIVQPVPTGAARLLRPYWVRSAQRAA